MSALPVELQSHLTAEISKANLDDFSELQSSLLAHPQKEPVSRVGGYVYEDFGNDQNDQLMLLQVESWFGGGSDIINFWDAGSMQFVTPTFRPEGDRIPGTSSIIVSV